MPTVPPGVCGWSPASLATEQADCAVLKAELEAVIPKLTKKPLAAAKRLLANVEKQLADLDEVLAALG